MPNAGSVDTTTGTVVVDSFNPDVTTTIKFTADPNSNDLAPKRNQLLQILDQDVTISGEVDTIAVSGSGGAIKYSTTSRHKD